MSSKHSKYVVNQTLKDIDDISFRELFGRIKVSSFFSFFFFLKNKTCPSTRYLYLPWPIYWWNTV